MKNVACYLACFALAYLPAVPAHAQVLSKPVTLLVGFSAGGPTDQYARTLAPKLGAALGVPVIVENKTGANGSLATNFLARAKPDGYTLALSTSGQIVINPHLVPGSTDTFKDLAFIAPLVRYENVLLVNASAPYRTLPEFIAYAKANPDKANYGSGGTGASNHLAGVLLEMSTGVKLTHVPYRGSGPAMTDLLAGNITAMFDVLATGLPHVATGKVRAFAVTGAKRSRYAPEIPTFAEAGLPEFERLSGGLWFGIYAPPGLPPEVLAALRSAFGKIQDDADLRAKIVDLKYEPWQLSPEEYPDFYRTEYAKWGAAIKAGAVKTQ